MILSQHIHVSTLRHIWNDLLAHVGVPKNGPVISREKLINIVRLEQHKRTVAFVNSLFSQTLVRSLVCFLSFEDRWAGVDIGFVVEASDNVTPELWTNFLNIVKRTVDRFHVAPRSVNIGMVTFGDTSNVVFNFNTLPDEILNNFEVKRLVDKATLQGGAPRLDRGLKTAYKSLFTEENGMRRWLPKVCFGAVIYSLFSVTGRNCQCVSTFFCF